MSNRFAYTGLLFREHVLPAPWLRLILTLPLPASSSPILCILQATRYIITLLTAEMQVSASRENDQAAMTRLLLQDNLRDTPLVDLLVPLLFVHGSKDSMCEADIFAAVRKQISSADLQVSLPGKLCNSLCGFT